MHCKDRVESIKIDVRRECRPSPYATRALLEVPPLKLKTIAELKKAKAEKNETSG